MQQANLLDLQSLIDSANDYKLLQARNSKAYVQLMVDICSALNTCDLGSLQNIDAEELRTQTSHILYYHIKGYNDPIPCDVSLLTQLYSHYRKPTVIVLRRIQKYLCTEHRRFLGKLEREQAMERILNVGELDVNLKLQGAQAEMLRYQSMAELVRGGGRKLDILMQAMQIPGRTRFQLLTIDRMLRDVHHNRHKEVLEWLEHSRLGNDPRALHGLITNGLSVLDNMCNKIWGRIEELSGLELPRDKSKFDLNRNWYSLGDNIPRGEEFLKSFSDDEITAIKIKRLTFPMIKVDWDATRLGATRDRIIVDVNLPKIQASQLASLTFKIEEKITSSLEPKGLVILAIETDFENGMLSPREREEASEWARRNKIKLQNLVLETYDMLLDLRENKAVVLPEKLDTVIERIKASLEGDRKASQESIISTVEQLDDQDLQARFDKVKGEGDCLESRILLEWEELHRDIIRRMEKISIRNIAFHKQVRDSFDDLSAYEQKVLHLYSIEEKLEQMKDRVEEEIVKAFRRVSCDEIPERLLDICMDLIIKEMLVRLKKLDFEVINAQSYAKRYQEITKLEEPDCTYHLQMLLRECSGIPRADILLEMLRGWERQLNRDEMAEKESFILENNETLQILTDKLRADLREKMNEGNKGLSLEMRFEVYGLTDQFSGTLARLLKRLEAEIETIADGEEGEALVGALQALESQVLQAQKETKPESECFRRLLKQTEKGLMTKQQMYQWNNDLKRNFQALDRLLGEISGAIKKVKTIQNSLGAEKDMAYLNVTINIADIERLKEVYDFIDGVTLEDTKRFCVAYNLKTGLLNDIMVRAHKKDPTIPKEIRQHINRKSFKLYQEKRHISLQLKTDLLTGNKDILDAECLLLCHTLNLVKPESIRQKATYLGTLAILEQAKSADHQKIKVMRLLWGRIQKRLFSYQPLHHGKNYEGNRQALISDAREYFGD